MSIELLNIKKQAVAVRVKDLSAVGVAKKMQLDVVQVQQWLSDKPDIYKAIIIEGTSRIINKNEPWK